MAKQRRRARKTRLGDPAAVHTRKLATALELMEDFTRQGENSLRNGLCRTAAEALTTAIEARGAAKEHRSAGGLTKTQRLTDANVAVQRLRLKVLETCTRDD